MHKSTPNRPTLFLYRLFRVILPLSKQELAHWRRRAEEIPDEVLRTQALASLADKQFHADGGTVYAAADSQYGPTLVRLIVALQTISDYLDNLCDRANVLDGPTFEALHYSMLDAVTRRAKHRDYYQHFEHNDDGGYLNELVSTCQECVEALPFYARVEAQVIWYVERYSELQVYKHIHVDARVEQLTKWSAPYLDLETFGDVTWFEFAAAAGSTLGMFSLFLAATRPLDETAIETMHQQYFPWICGLHILLDYLIDLDEDAREGDFNFVSCYPNQAYAHKRIRHFALESRKRANRVHFGGKIHRFVVQGLIGMYLSDPKVNAQKDVKKARRMIYTLGPTTMLFYVATWLYRRTR